MVILYGCMAYNLTIINKMRLFTVVSMNKSLYKLEVCNMHYK